jgi:hypothetical protein
MHVPVLSCTVICVPVLAQQPMFHVLAVQVLVSTPQRNYTIADLSSLFTAIGDTQSVSPAVAATAAALHDIQHAR